MRRRTRRSSINLAIALVGLILTIAVLAVGAYLLSTRYAKSPSAIVSGPLATPTQDELARKEQIAQRVLDAYQAAVEGEPLPRGLAPAVERRIREEVGYPDASHVVAWQPQRPIVWEEVPPPPGYDEETAAVMRATFRGGKGRTEDPSVAPTITVNWGIYPYDLAGMTFEVLLEKRGGEWVATDVADNDGVDGR